MCMSCGCLEYPNDHGDAANIDLADLADAATAAGISVEQAAKNLASACINLIGTTADATKSRADTGLAACRVIKATKARQFTLGVAYPANKADASKAADGHRDFVSPEVLEQTAWDWLVKYKDVNLFHSEGTLGHFTPTESYIWRGPDWEQVSPVDGKPYVVKGGDWMLGGVWDDLGWAYVQARLVNGWSPEGGAQRATPTADRLAQLRSR